LANGATYSTSRYAVFSIFILHPSDMVRIFSLAHGFEKTSIQAFVRLCELVSYA